MCQQFSSVDLHLVGKQGRRGAQAGAQAARVTQLLDLLLLAPELQLALLALLALEAVDDVEPMSERALQVVAHAGTWMQQRMAWEGRQLADSVSF